MENIKGLFYNEVAFFFSSSGKEGTENSIFKLYRLLRTWITFPFALFGIQTIHLNTSFDLKAFVRDFVLILWGRLARKSVVVQFHGGEPENLSLLNNMLVVNLYRRLIKGCSVLTLTENQAKWVESSLGIHPIKMKNYVKVSKFEKKEGQVLNFLYMGRIVKEKGVFYIVKCAEKLLDRNVRFDIYGVGEDVLELEKTISQSPAKDIITYHGSVSGEAKDDALKKSDVFLFPSYYPEGLPYSVLEAMSFKNAIVCTNAGALRELLVDQTTCIKIEMKSVDDLLRAINVLLDDGKLRRRLADSAYELVESSLSLTALKSKLTEVWND